MKYYKITAILCTVFILLTGCSAPSASVSSPAPTSGFSSVSTETTTEPTPLKTTLDTTAATTTTVPDPSPIIQNDESGIPDAVLYSAILTKLNKKSNSCFTVNDASRLTFFSYSAVYQKVKSLKGIEKLSNLTRLSITDCEITDFSPVLKLKNLKNLNLSKNKISNISCASGLKNLDILNFSYNDITDVTPLGQLGNLKELYLWFNRIQDIRPLLKLHQLKTLNLESNYIDMSNSEMTAAVNQLRKMKNFALGLQGAKVGDDFKAPVKLYIDRQQAKDENNNIYYVKASINDEEIAFNKLYVFSEPGLYELKMRDNLNTDYHCNIIIKP
ncbi:MAG: hypothetical protein BGN88_06095 [Clostridiales bacterium 43-6]|nr:MAG: hypothetical protein BGN88_06095 [Clostridiales bacterium 43-6]